MFNAPLLKLLYDRAVGALDAAINVQSLDPTLAQAALVSMNMDFSRDGYLSSSDRLLRFTRYLLTSFSHESETRLLC